MSSRKSPPKNNAALLSGQAEDRTLATMQLLINAHGPEAVHHAFRTAYLEWRSDPANKSQIDAWTLNEAEDEALWDEAEAEFDGGTKSIREMLVGMSYPWELKHDLAEAVRANEGNQNCGTCGMGLDPLEECGKVVGCSGCDKAFCSAACLEEHEQEVGHAS